MNEPLTDDELSEIKLNVSWEQPQDDRVIRLIATVENLKKDIKLAHITIKTKQQICERGEEENAKLKAELHKLEDENDKLTGVIGKPFTDMDRQ
jgi:hypothetical protein